MVRRMALLVLLLGAGLLPARPAAAAGAFGPPITVMTAPCPEAFVHADAAAGADGRIYGFARFRGRGCNDRIWYFEGDGASWTSQVTPYKGRILGVARGGGPTTYLLYSDGRNARITKRVGGTFSPGRAIGGVPGGGDVIAAGGTWWAVWREGARRLKEARTGGRSRPVPIAVGDFGKDNTSFLVSLAPRPGGGAVVAAECCRKAGPDPYEDIGAIQVGVTANGVWVPRFSVRAERCVRAAASGQLRTGDLAGLDPGVAGAGHLEPVRLVRRAHLRDRGLVELEAGRVRRAGVSGLGRGSVRAAGRLRRAGA